jgi:hypothetical protein
MKYIINAFLLLIASLLLPSCNEDTFSQVVDFDVPAVKNKLVLNCNFTVGDDTIKVLLGKTRNVGETKNSDGLEKCKVSLYRNNAKIADIPYKGPYFDQNAKLYQLAGVKNLIKDKNLYTIKVEHPDFESIEASQDIPDAPQISQPFFLAKGFSSNDIFSSGEKYDLAQFELLDPAAENFYMLAGYSVFKDTINDLFQNNTEYFYLDKLFSNGGIFEDLGNVKHFLNDEKFNGKRFAMKLGVSPFSFGNFLNPDPNFDFTSAKRVKIIFNLYSISKQKYLYETSITAKDEGFGNFFGEPVTVNSNVINGYGIFSIRNLSTIEIKLP